MQWSFHPVEHYGFSFKVAIIASLSIVCWTFGQEMKVLGVWSTFNSQMNMRCICSQSITYITPKFYVNISLSSPALFHGAWIAQSLQSSSDSMWHLVKNKYYSYPPSIDLWFDLRYEVNAPQPTGACNWAFKDPTIQEITTGTITPSPETVTTLSTTPSPSNDHVNDTSEDEQDECKNKSTTTQSSTPEVRATSAPDVIASCLCPCSCVKKTQEEIDAMIREIIGDLAIDVNNTALARRKLSSASDTRWVSRGIGFVGVLVMTCVFGSIALSDYKRFVSGFRLLIGNLRGQHGS